MARQEDAYAFRFEGCEYRIAKLLISEARALQNITGFTMGQFDERLKLGDVECLAALLWVARKRQEPTLKYAQVDGDVGSFEPLDDDESDEPSDDDGAGAEGNGRVEPEAAAALQ